MRYNNENKIIPFAVNAIMTNLKSIIKYDVMI